MAEDKQVYLFIYVCIYLFISVVLTQAGFNMERAAVILANHIFHCNVFGMLKLIIIENSVA
jgi:hypothetical protein